MSGEALLGERSYGIDPEVCDYIASEIKEISELGVELVVVFGGGNIFRGISAERHGMNRTTGDYIGMLATVMNSLALGSSLRKIGVDCRVQSALDMPKVCESYIRDKAMRQLDKGRIVITAAGSGNPYFSTDTAAAMRACELECQIVFKATKVDGVYDKDPMKESGAKKFQTLTHLDIVKNGYGVMDKTAVTLCMDNDLPILVLGLMEKGNIKKAITGEKIGTLIS